MDTTVSPGHDRAPGGGPAPDGGPVAGGTAGSRGAAGPGSTAGAGSAGGLRERKKAATRQALHEAALRLATEHGIDNVTVEAIADAATVSRRTFSNYFSSKEEALFHADRVFIERLVALVHARPADEPPWTALTRAADEFLPHALDEDRVASRRLIRNHPSLITHQVAVYATIERALAAELAQRLPAGGDSPLRSRVLAATFLTTVRVTTQHWLDHPGRRLPELIHEALGFTADRS